MSARECSKCNSTHSGDEKCPLWALERKLLTALIDVFDANRTEDQKLVLGVAGGIHMRDWGRLVALSAVNPEAIEHMAAKLRALRTEYQQ